MLQRWQIGVVAALLVVAWLIDVQLFAILAGVAVAGVVFAEVHGRARAKRNATQPLVAAVRSALGLPDEVPPGGDRLRIDGRPVELVIDARRGEDGTLRGCLDVRAATGRTVPFCLVGQRRRPTIALPSLVANAALFDTPLECELQAAPDLGRPPLDAFEWASSSPGALGRLLEAGVEGPIARLAGEPGVALAAVQFDGTSVRALLVPDDPRDGRWVEPTLRDVTAIARAVGEALDRVATE